MLHELTKGIHKADVNATKSSLHFDRFSGDTMLSFLLLFIVFRYLISLKKEQKIDVAKISDMPLIIRRVLLS